MIYSAFLLSERNLLRLLVYVLLFRSDAAQATKCTLSRDLLNRTVTNYRTKPEATFNGPEMSQMLQDLMGDNDTAHGDPQCEKMINDVLANLRNGT